MPLNVFHVSEFISSPGVISSLIDLYMCALGIVFI